MGMNYNEFRDYIKEHGTTKARITKGMHNIPKGTILFFGINDDKLSTYNEHTHSKNIDFGYGFDYSWRNIWKNEYEGEFELIDEKKQNSPSKNVMTTKTIYEVLAVNKKTGKTEKKETHSADNEQQAILKTFGVDAENMFIKVAEVGKYEEDKPLRAVIEKETTSKATPKN